MNPRTVLTDPTSIERVLLRAVEHVYPSCDAFRERLSSGERLTVYLGIDPTGPSLHIGNAVVLRKLAELQKLGHKIILLIGDFTAMIGDPTDKTATRKPLTREDVLANCCGYKEQASRIFDFDGENPVEMRFNSEWLGKMTFADVVGLASHFTVQQMLERDMFQKRMAESKPVGVHEFLYPLMQGYDTVVLNADLEIGGNDQTFNMLAGRALMREMKGKEKFVLTCKLLVDPSGKKMGKSEGNMIALTDAPEDMYGKVMSWTDGMIAGGFELCTDVPMDEIRSMEEQMKQGENPMTFKRRLAKEIVAEFVSQDAAEKAEAHFTSVHQRGELPEEIPTFSIAGDEIGLIEALVSSGLISSKTEARRQIEQGAVRVDDVVANNVNTSVRAGSVLQKGKRHFIRLER